MDVPTLITFTRDQWSVVSSNVDDTTLLRYLNIAYHNIENAIVDRVAEDYFWDTFTFDTVADQNEYTMPINSSTVTWIKKISKVEIKWKAADSYSTLLRPDDVNNAWVVDGYLGDKLNVANAFWQYRDDSIFIYPTPTESVTWGGIIYAVKALIDLTAAGAETTVFPNHSDLRQYHHLIGLGALPFVLRHRYEWDPNMIISAENIYRVELQSMIDNLNSKYNKPQELVLPNPEKRY